ncbi:MAG: phenylalanine--tRNA ligase subunit beta [Chloroflexi bacterium]|nr:MAG: phenylalanine--tRNA ligase subunit beta [Chloroflexota bacterium]
MTYPQKNKSLTHRPDTFGIIGFAREVAAIQGKAFQTPAWLSATRPDYGPSTNVVAAPSVAIDVPELSARYQAVVLSDADGSAVSPINIQTYLARVGVRPISAIVDVTNYLMMVTGQPLHAFDYDKLVALNDGKADIHVRAGKPGESLELIDGRTVDLSDNDIVIANGNVVVALAGAMGGRSTEIDSSTKNIILESATFNLYNLRNTQMRHGIFSEAITRFTKGQPAQLTAPVLAAAIRLLQESAGAMRVSDVADTLTDLPAPIQIEVSVDAINSTLGSKFAAADIVDTLQNVEFAVAIRDDGTSVMVTAPFWRSDIHIAEDIIEEIGRLNGFDSIEPTLPERDFTAVSPDSFDRLRATVRQTLARAGANEVLTYSFVHGDLLQKATLKADNSYRITNSISPDLQYYRQTLTPSLLNLVHANSKAGFEQFALFELNKVHAKSAGMTDDNVPVELDRVGLILADRQQKGAAYYQAKRLIEYLGESLGLQLEFKPLPEATSLLIAQPFEYRRSARVIDVNSGMALGVIGEYKKSVVKNFKLPEYTAGFELLGEGLALAVNKASIAYQPSSRYPSTTRDVCFRVDDSVSYGSIIESLGIASIEEVIVTVQPIDIYQAQGDTQKNVTVRLKLTPYGETLDGESISRIIGTLSSNVVHSVGATII